MTAISKEDKLAISGFLQQRLAGPVALDVWTREQSTILRTDRDSCTHCDETRELARELASLHPGISITLYDLDRHADRAAEAGIDRPPVTVIRARGRELRIIGYWSGGLFPPVVDALTFAAAGTTPLKDATREVLAGLADDVELELLIVPYDPYSAQMLRLVAAFGVESRRVRVQVTEMAEFPLLAAARGLTEVPVLVLNGHRYVGAWEEGDLVEQVRRVAAGDGAPVIRDHAPSSPFVTEDEALRLAAEAQQQGPQAAAPGGIVLPGNP